MSDGPVSFNNQAFHNHDIEASLHELYEHAPCGFLSTTLDGVIVRVNETFIAMSGYGREQLLGTQVLSILTPGGQLFYESRYLPVLHLQGKAHEIALMLQKPSGEEAPVLVNGMVVTDEDGLPVAIRTAVFPYSGRKEYEKELLDARRSAETSEARLRILHDAGVAFSAADDDSQLAEELVSAIRSALTAPEAAVYLYGDSKLTLAAGAAALSTPQFTDAAQTAIDERRVISLGEDHPSLAKHMRAARIQTVAVVPLADHHEPLGAVVLFFKRARALKSDDVELAETLALQAAEVLARLRAERVLERMALHDELTGFPTRRLIEARLNDEIDRAQAAKVPLSVVTVAIDGLTQIKNTFGSTAAEKALVEISTRVSEQSRDGDLVGRVSEHQFVIISPDLGTDGADALGSRLLESIRRPLHDAAEGTTGTANIGIAVYSGRGRARPSARDLFEGATQALHQAKGMGTNRAAIAAIGDH